MDNLGVAINETTLANYALEKGLKKSTQAMTTQEKVGLAMQMFLEKTAEYAGNYAKENDTLAGAMQTAKAAWDNLLSGAENFTAADFVDSIENMFRVLTRNVTKIVPRLTSSFAEIGKRAVPKIKEWFTGFWNVDLPKMATDAVNGIISKINSIFGTDFKPIDPIKLPTAEEITEDLNSLWNTVTTTIGNAFTWTLGLFTPPDGDAVIDSVFGLSSWWYDTVLPFIQETFRWTVGLFQPPGEGVDPNGYIAAWWTDTVLPFLNETCTWVLNMFLPPDENGDITPESVIMGWWDNVSGLVEAACTWVLGIFGEPEEDGDQAASVLYYWWDNVRQSIVDACKWALGLFGTPVESLADIESIMSTWWSGVVTTVTDACVWFLSLFKAPKSAEDGNGPGAIMATWWNRVVDTVVGACQWFLGLFSGVSSDSDAEGNIVTPVGIMKKWWEKTVDTVVGVCKWFLGLFSGVSNGTDADGNTITAASIVEEWWENTVNSVVAACTWFLGLFTGVSDSKDAEGNTVTAADVVKGWWETVRAGVIAACTWTIGLFDGVAETNAEGESADGVVSRWWGTVVDSVVAACQWTLNLFMPPDEDVDADGSFSGWWTNYAAPALRELSAWTIGMFMPPDDDIDSNGAVFAWWHNTALPALDDICQWALGMFGVPVEEVDGDGLFSTWWNNTASPIVQEICQWALSLFSGVSDTNQEGNSLWDVITGWWSNQVKLVQTACQWALGLFGAPNASGMSIWALISTWWSNNKRFAESALVWTLKLFGMPSETAEQVKTTVAGWWSTVEGKVQEACTFVARLAGFDFSATDENGNPVSISDSASTWWTTKVVPAIKDVFKWIVGIEWGEWNETSESDAKNWWKTVKDNVSKIIEDLGGIGKSLLDVLFGTAGTAVQVAGGTSLPEVLASLTGFFEDFTTGAQWIINNAEQLSGGIELIAAAFAIFNAAIGNYIPLILMAVTMLGKLINAHEELVNESFQDWTAGKYSEEAIKKLQEYIELEKEAASLYDAAFRENAEFLDKKKWSEVAAEAKKVREELAAMKQSPYELDIVDSYKSWVMYKNNLTNTTGSYGSPVYQPVDFASADSWIDVIVGVSDESKALMQTELDRMGLSTGVKLIPDTSLVQNAINQPTRTNFHEQGEGWRNPLGETIVHKKAVGLNYVPYNEFPSLLHEGEAVLTKAQATAWRRGEGTEGVSIDYDRMAEIVANAVVQAVSGLAIQMDKQTVGTIVSPVVFNEMGRQLNRKRFAT